MKNKPLSLIYINLAQPYQKTLEVLTRTNNNKVFVNNTGVGQTIEKLFDMKKYWTIATSNL